MAYVRGQAAYAEETVRRVLHDQLVSLGWMFDVVPDPLPMLPYSATTPVTLIDYLPAKESAVADNTVAMTSGDEDDDVDQELGAASGGLFQTTRVYFLDIFGESQGIALRIADDIKAVLTGKLPGTNRYVPVVDPVNGGTLAGHLLEITDVTRTKPQSTDYKRNWQVVKCTVGHTFSAVEGPLP